MRKIVEKKILPKHFDEVIHDRKRFEIRKDEDDLQIGDAVILKEWDGEKYTGRETGMNIVYILRDVPKYGLMPGYVIFGWQKVKGDCGDRKRSMENRRDGYQTVSG